jgi:RNA polymerase sigma-70 factor (ECF subfamily)
MDEVSPIPELLKRSQAGDQDAAAKLFERYARRLTSLAQQHLSRKMAGRLDGEDVVQSVFRTFFRRSAQGEFRIGSSNDLWQLLVKITVLKTRAKGRHHRMEMRDVRVEQSPGEDAWWLAAVAQDPSPDDAAAFVDQVEALVRGLPLLYGQVLDLRLQGHNQSQVATQLGVSRRTVHRVLDQLQERLEESASRGYG